MVIASRLRAKPWHFVGCAAVLLAASLPQSATCEDRIDSAQETLFQGIDYIREAISEPVPAVVHILKVDLSTPGVRVFVTPPDFPGQDLALKARTTSQFVAEYGLQAAINGSMFYPFDRKDPRSYMSDLHEPKGVKGSAASDGVEYGEADFGRPMLNVSPDGHAVIGYRLARPWYTAITGTVAFITAGRPNFRAAAPETAVAVDETGTVLFLVVVDYAQPTNGAEADDRAVMELLIRHGAFSAMTLDGGGSSTMVVSDGQGGTRLLNLPVQGFIPGLERPVGNHIGVYALPLGKGN